MSQQQIPTDRHITYTRQFRRCGNAYCHCRTGPYEFGHGPYVYAYWRSDDGKMHSAYVGKSDPAIAATILGKQEEHTQP